MSRAKNFSKSGVINIGFQILFLLFFYLIGNDISLNVEGVWKHLSLTILVLIPSAIWTLFFYFQDRIEPEPAAFVMVSFLAGMAFASLFALPLEKNIFNINQWLYASTTFLSLGSIIVIGGVASFMVYLVIRYGFYPTKEFDEPADGMVYGAFIGAGFAFIESLAYLSSHPEFTLFAIAYTATTNILVYASVSSLVGYFIGRAKFSGGNPQAASLVAIIVGMVLIGVYHILNEFIFLAGMENAFWLSVLLTMVFAVAILTVVYLKMRKLTEAPLHVEKAVKVRPDFLVMSLFIILLIIGGFTKNSAMQGLLFQDRDHRITFRYPATLSLTPWSELPSSFFGAIPLTTTLFSARGSSGGELYFFLKAKKESIQLADINTLDYIGNIETVSFLADRIEVAGKKAVRLKYSLVDKSRLETGNFPKIYWIFTDIIPSKDYTYILSLCATPENFDKKTELYEDILKTIQWND
jgi:RsiW-degrading membrane proteinase PrsW (M82 family)